MFNNLLIDALAAARGGMLLSVEFRGEGAGFCFAVEIDAEPYRRIAEFVSKRQRFKAAAIQPKLYRGQAFRQRVLLEDRQFHRERCWLQAGLHRFHTARRGRRSAPASAAVAFGGTFAKSGPSPSAIVGCAMTASRSRWYGRPPSITVCTTAMTSPASAPIIVKPRMRSSPPISAFMNPCVSRVVCVRNTALVDNRATRAP